MKHKESCFARLFWVVCLGSLACLVLIAGMGRAMAPLNDQHRKKAVQELYESYKKNFPEVPEVTPEEAMQLLQAGEAVFVDVRPRVESEVSKLPGAISAGEFLQCPESYQGKTAIVYDTVGYRSGLFANKLRKKGLGVANLRGGLLGWLHACGKIYDSHGNETRRVHVYGCIWNYAPAECETVR